VRERTGCRAGVEATGASERRRTQTDKHRRGQERTATVSDARVNESGKNTYREARKPRLSRCQDATQTVGRSAGIRSLSGLMSAAMVAQDDHMRGPGVTGAAVRHARGGRRLESSASTAAGVGGSAVTP